MGFRVVYVTGRMMTEIIRQGAENHTRVTQGLPADAVLVRIIPDRFDYFETKEPTLGLVYQSSEFSELPEGSVIPDLQIIFERS